jgi:hypothetical protein
MTDVKAFLEVAKGFGVTTQAAENGLQKVTLPQGQSAFLKSTPGWALLSLSPEMINAVPADPSKLLGPLAKEYDVAVQIHVQNVPESYRQQAVDAMSQGAQAGREKKEGESEEQHAQRQKLVDAQLNQIKQFMNELDRLMIGLSIDSKQQRAFVDVVYTGVPNSNLAKELAHSADPTAAFSGFVHPNAAMTFAGASQSTEANRAQVDQVIASVQGQLTASIDDSDEFDDAAKEKLKAAVGDFAEAAKATINSGTVEAAGSLDLTAESMTFVAGGNVADPKKIESGLKNLLEVAKAKHGDEAPKATWDAEKYKDITFSKIEADVPSDKEDARKLLGEKLQMYVGLGKNTVYFAAGSDALAAVKKAIDESAGKKPTPFAVTFALGQIMTAAKTFADDEDKAQIEAVAQMLESQANGRDHVRFAPVAIENGIRVRIEAEEGVLKAIGMAAMQQQMRAAQGQ